MSALYLHRASRRKQARLALSQLVLCHEIFEPIIPRSEYGKALGSLCSAPDPGVDELCRVFALIKAGTEDRDSEGTHDKSL